MLPTNWASKWQTQCRLLKHCLKAGRKVGSHLSACMPPHPQCFSPSMDGLERASQVVKHSAVAYRHMLNCPGVCRKTPSITPSPLLSYTFDLLFLCCLVSLNGCLGPGCDQTAEINQACRILPVPKWAKEDCLFNADSNTTQGFGRCSCVLQQMRPVHINHTYSAWLAYMGMTTALTI